MKSLKHCCVRPMSRWFALLADRPLRSGRRSNRSRRLAAELLEDRRLMAVGDLLHSLFPEASNDQMGEEHGSSVAATSSYRIVGAPFADLQSFLDSGVVRVYDASNDLLHTLNNPSPASNDRFGWSVAAAGNYVVVGAPLDDTQNYNQGAAYVFDVTVNLNQPPSIVVNAAALSANEGTKVANTGTFSDAQGNSTVTLAATVNGVAFGSVTRNDANGTWSWSANVADGPAGGTVTITATDDQGAVATATFTYAVNNVPPTALIAGPASGVRGQTLSYTGSFSDPGTLDTHTLTWEVRDGDNAMVVTGSGAAFNFTPTNEGSYTVTFVVTDDDGGIGAAVQELNVGVWAIQDDPCCAGETALIIGGTTGNDIIAVSPGATTGQLAVTLNGVLLGNDFAPTGHVIVYAQAGDDDVQVAGSIGLSTWLFGGDGDDRLKSGVGHDVLDGGAGNDLLIGGSGRDLLVGGTGADRIVGNADDDILIAGWLRFADRNAALCAIMAEWTSTRDDMTRIANLSNRASGDRANGNVCLIGVDDPATSEDERTVLDDDAKDVLTGSAGLDWFFFDKALDRATDLKDEIFTNDLDWILS